MLPIVLHTPAVVLAVVVLVAVTTTDVVSGTERLPLGVLILSVLATALTVSVQRTAAIAVLASGAGVLIVASGSTADGSMADARLALLVLGSAACILGASRGALARTRALETASHEQRYRAILETADEGVAVFDGESRLVWANSRLSDLLGMTPDALLGVPADEVVTGTSQRGAAGLDPEASPFRRETPHVRPDGRRVELVVAGRPLLDANGGAGFVRFYTDVTDRRQAERDLQRLALFDQVTGLANRALFLDRLAHELARRDRPRLAVLVLDLDKFRAVNDSLGHRSGDQLLALVARRLLSTVRPFDTVARLGADEFALLCPEVTDADDAVAVADRLNHALREPLTLAGLEMSATASIGVALAPEPVRGAVDEADEALPTSDADRLLREAEAAMHVAKQHGRGSCEIYEPSMSEQASDRLRVLSELPGALARDEFRVHYQPITGLGNGGVKGVECLVRWQHPTRGLLLPGDFLAVAEDSGLVLELGFWVLRAAAQQAARWEAAGTPVNISVNLSVRQLLHPRLVDDVAAVLAEIDLPPARLTLEVTESALIVDLAAASVVLDQLHDLGIRLALDDFGTGYCSLAYLRHLPVDELKLDRSFLVDLDDRASHAVIGAAVDLAHALGMVVVGEGVERPEQLDVLRQLRCDLAQGFLLGRPVPSDELRLLDAPVAQPGPTVDRFVRSVPRIPTRRGPIARQT